MNSISDLIIKLGVIISVVILFIGIVEQIERIDKKLDSIVSLSKENERLRIENDLMKGVYNLNNKKQWKK